MGSSLLSLFLLVILSSCSNFHTGRSFLTEMEHDDSNFFNPRQDFPVVGGDSGRDWISGRERRDRTPLSETELRKETEKEQLRRELRTLENAQTGYSYGQYEKYSKFLNTISEKIYFLKLHPSERVGYLRARGFVQNRAERNEIYSDRHPAQSQTSLFLNTILNRDSSLNLGMTKGQVKEILGRPSRVEIAGNPRFENERWGYLAHGGMRYVYFESGLVGGWE